MAEKTLANQAVALAAIFQACDQVKEVAWHGHHSPELLETAIHSIFQLEAHDIEDVFGGFHNLRQGALVLKQQLGNASEGRDIEVTRYAATLLHLERKLMGNSKALNALRSGIETAINQAQYFESTHENVISSLAELYRSVISPLGPKVLVNGEQRFLADDRNAKLIRVFLLAALRATVLWRQCGGSRFRLIFQRGKYIEAAQHLL